MLNRVPPSLHTKNLILHGLMLRRCISFRRYATSSVTSGSIANGGVSGGGKDELVVNLQGALKDAMRVRNSFNKEVLKVG